MWKRSTLCTHLCGVGTQHVLMDGRDQNLRQVLDMLFRFHAAALHTAGHAAERLRQVVLQSCPERVGGPAPPQLVHVLCRQSGLRLPQRTVSQGERRKALRHGRWTSWSRWSSRKVLLGLGTGLFGAKGGTWEANRDPAQRAREAPCGQASARGSAGLNTWCLKSPGKRLDTRPHCCRPRYVNNPPICQYVGGFSAVQTPPP